MNNDEKTIDEVIEGIAENIEMQRRSTSKLYETLRDVEKLIDSLENDSGSWLADGVFRPGNNQRKKDAISSLKQLKKTTLNAIDESEMAVNTVVFKILCHFYTI